MDLKTPKWLEIVVTPFVVNVVDEFMDTPEGVPKRGKLHEISHKVNIIKLVSSPPTGVKSLSVHDAV